MTSDDLQRHDDESLERDESADEGDEIDTDYLDDEDYWSNGWSGVPGEPPLGESDAPPNASFYLNTIVTVSEGGRWIPAAHSEAARSVALYVITAWNPGDERPTASENDEANSLLHDLLIERGLRPIPALRAHPDSNHAEESWAVVGLNDNEARQIGAALGQVAVFRLSEHDQTVLACADDWSVSRPVRSSA